MYGIVSTKLPDEAWGSPTIARVIPSDRDQWGTLVFLKGTIWEPLFPIIPPAVLDQALRGFATPLMRVIGPPTRAIVKRLPVENATCRNRLSCLSATDKCIPGSSVPFCWEAPGFETENRDVLNYVVQLWREGIPVIVLST